MSKEISDVPLAVLWGLDQSERVWPLRQLPPPQELLVPVRMPMTVSIDADPCQPLPPHRVFRLSLTLRSKDHRWWEVYNDGRSRTPHDGFVYLEQSR